MAIAFDMDGCLKGTPWLLDNQFPKWNEPTPYPPAFDLVRQLQDDVIIVSNQGGIQYGYKSVTAAIAEMRWLMKLLPIQRAYFCPDKGDTCVWCSRMEWGQVNQISHAGWNFRKPNSGMAQLAAEHGYPIYRYYGDMSGTQEYGYNGRDSDRMFAANSGIIQFIDIREVGRSG